MKVPKIKVMTKEQFRKLKKKTDKILPIKKKK